MSHVTHRSLRFCILFNFVLSTLYAYAEEVVVPLPNAHAHNDYTHARPLLDALDHGFCSVEADIYLVDGALLVGHDLKDVRAEKTLQALYLDPLLERVKKNGGRVYPNGPEVMLLIDLKSDGATTYAALRDVLKHYAEMLTSFEADGVEHNAVMVVITGDSPRDMIAAETPRLAAVDGRMADLDANAPKELVPLFSEQWQPLFKWYGKEEMPKDVRIRLREIVSKAHEQGRKTRFYAAPDVPAIWDELLSASVDFVNTDKIEEFSSFMKKAKEDGPSVGVRNDSR